jgi:hypothetical protein
MRRLLGAIAASGAAVMALGTVNVGATSLPSPGSASQVAALVAASPSITTLNSTVEGELPSAGVDFPSRLYGLKLFSGCRYTTSCVLADKKSKKVIVLFGDSHAFMWVPSVVPWAKANKYKLLLLWERGCPPADLPTQWLFLDNVTQDQGVMSQPSCIAWRNSTISAIEKLKPALVLLGERTSLAVSEPSGAPFTEAQWQAALQTTITSLQSATTKVAVIEDAPWHSSDVPQCLAAYPTNVQKCSVPYPNPAALGEQPAESAAAAANGAGFITTLPWLCTSDGATCSAVIGNFITYRDTGHLTATYAQYLSQVMGLAIKAIL